MKSRRELRRVYLLPRYPRDIYLEIEAYYFEISTEERWRRVRKRNEEKSVDAYYWKMSKEEFDNQDPRRRLPDPMPGLKFIKVTE